MKRKKEDKREHRRKDVRDFNQIRNVIASIYTYGFLSREDFIQRHIVGSLKSYDNTIERLRDLYLFDLDEEQSALKKDTQERGKYKCYKFRRDHFSQTVEQLAAVFGLFAISEYEIEDIVRCLSTVVNSSSEQGVVVSDIANLYFNEEDHSPAIRRRLKDLEKNGYIAFNKETRSYVTNDPLLKISDDDLIRLYFLVSFYVGMAYPRVPVLFLLKALRRHLVYRKVKVPPDVFLFRDNTCGNILDEHIVYQLLGLCKSHCFVRISWIEETKKDTMVAPVALKIDKKLGRWYLLALRGDDVPVMIRVSNIKKVTRIDETFDYAQTRKKVFKEFQFSHFSGSQENTSNPIHIEAELYFNSAAIRTSFERELLFGKIERRNGKEYYCADVADISELKPFLRSYGAYLRVLPSDRHKLDIDLQEEYKRMLSAYGIVQ